jgi:hypothetical protein
MTGRNEEDAASSAQDLEAILEVLSEIEKTLVASELPVAAEHVAAAKRTIERQR